jgi:hypothetical protein
MQTVTSTIYAGFWRRVAAVLLDGLVLAIVEVPIALLLVAKTLVVKGVAPTTGVATTGGAPMPPPPSMTG